MLKTFENKNTKNTKDVSNENISFDSKSNNNLLNPEYKKTVNKAVNTIKQKEQYLDTIADLKRISSECELYYLD